MTRQSILANAYVKDYMKSATVTDEALKAEYDKFKAESGGNEYKARHILVKTEDEAKDIIAKLEKDVKAFEGLAKAKSEDPGSKAKGGDLGWFNPKNMVPEFGEAVAKLEKGKFTCSTGEIPVRLPRDHSGRFPCSDTASAGRYQSPADTTAATAKPEKCWTI
jgi:peptidyl-prolyl cis-trans isomerase C